MAIKRPNVYAVLKETIADGMTVPEWWKRMRNETGHRFSDYVNFFGRSVLLRSLRQDIARGEKPPKEVLDEFPELNN